MQSLESAGEITNQSEIDDIPATEGDVGIGIPATETCFCWLLSSSVFSFLF